MITTARHGLSDGAHLNSCQMVVIRATQKVRRYLPKSLDHPGESDTALGDWYVNRIVVDRKPLLILVSSASLLSILTPARSVRTLPSRLPGLVRDRLRRLRVSAKNIDAEVDAMSESAVSPTQSRSIVGTMVEFGRLVPHYLPKERWDASDLVYAESQLETVPSHLPGDKRNFVRPGDLAVRCMEKRRSSISRR